MASKVANTLDDLSFTQKKSKLNITCYIVDKQLHELFLSNMKAIAEVGIGDGSVDAAERVFRDSF